jgi:hypothetical protein
LLDFVRFIQYDNISTLLGEKKIAKLAEKIKEGILKLEAQFRKIVLNETQGDGFSD